MENPAREHSKDINEDQGIPKVILPSEFKNCSRTDLVVLISRMLVSLIAINENSATMKPDDQITLTRYHSKIPPNISIFNYFIRLTKFSSLEHCVLMTSLYYIDLLQTAYPDFALNSLTAHRFLLTATTVAAKGLCDSFSTNAHYAKVGGVRCHELNILENDFLKRVNYRIIPRDHNITLCSIERKQKKFVIDKNALGSFDLDSYSYGNRAKSGYNVLDKYYQRIVQLVGSFDASPDKSRKIDYVLPSNIDKDNENGSQIPQQKVALSHNNHYSQKRNSEAKEASIYHKRSKPD
ncbi:pho80p [Saccharomyces arboricola H-6]|uniref:Pho80p n=1 Tax=Saccharomyces arboricola (strain H-6 / AS 2.3317 / CBS 10644) TaxID=1160507 RepID=J8Q2C9_SACAR|nr:pho80p [Saccharomyces arboricola H-6]